MNLINHIEEKLSNLLLEIGYEDNVILTLSSRPDLGDYQYNGSFSLGKKYSKNPADIANEIIEKISSSDLFKEVNAAGPFINLTFSDKALVDYINDVNKDLNINFPTYDKKLYFLDYGGANVAKELHVGHLRSANIGEALNRLFKSVGYKTISDVHLGDWGRPMGLIIREIKEMYPDLPYFNENYEKDYPKLEIFNEINLNDIYPSASIKASNDETYLNEAREITSLLQSGHKGYTALWKEFTSISKEEIKTIYDKLNAKFDLWDGESDADKYIPEMMSYLTENNMVEKSEGATVINIKKEDDNKEMPPLILIKSDGGVLYDTTELATIYYRMKKYKPDNIIYLTDSRQSLHFERAFRAAYKTKIVPPNTKLEHIGFGTVNGKEGKPYKTRDGEVLSLKELIELVTKETRKIIKDNIKEEEKDSLAESLAIAAIKYADLLPNPASDYIFDPLSFSDLNGKTGLYLLYSTVRMKSLLDKCQKENLTPKDYSSLETKEERDIIINLLHLKTVIEKCVSSRGLNELAEHLYKLTNSFNSFYSSHEILGNPNHMIQINWVTLTNIVYQTNLKLLNILGIDVPDKI